jgi:hypothetical protein
VYARNLILLQVMEEEWRGSRRVACAGLSFDGNIETPICAFSHLLEMELLGPKAAIVRAVTRNLQTSDRNIKSSCNISREPNWFKFLGNSDVLFISFSSVQCRSRHEVVSAVICE